MKKFVVLALLAFVSSLAIYGQQWQWPIAGKKAGSDILYAPQSFIDRELNFASLIVGGTEGDVVVAPFDGKVSNIFLTYMDGLSTSIAGDADFNIDFDTSRRDFVKNSERSARFVSHSISIAAPNGNTLSMSGLKLRRRFKTGERISVGDTLGTMAYSYKKVPEPSVMISVSHYGKAADPMSPFGLKTTFKAPEPITPKQFLTAQQAKEDIKVLTDILVDCYPSLDEFITKDALMAYSDSLAQSITGKVDMVDFVIMIMRMSAFFHDSHINFWPSWGIGKRTYWNLYLGLVGDSVRVVNATDGFTGYLDRSVTAIDGIGTDSVTDRLKKYVADYDAKSESFPLAHLLWNFNSLYANNTPGKFNGFTVTLDNGETIKNNRHEGHKKPMPARKPMGWTNRNTSQGFSTRMLNDSTAYIGISTFNLDETATDSIRNFIHRNLDTPHMIVDVRNNGGGSGDVLNKLLSYCSDNPYATTRHSCKVNRRGHFPSMIYCRNYTPELDIFGEEYKELEGRDGLYCQEEESTLMPDAETAYGGRLYVLVDELSCSAATLFPANIARSHRGVIIGRETRTAYAYMTALKFADFTLPNSMLNWRIPLVKCIFDETISPRFPRGRGVIPDIEVPLTKSDLTGEKDTILDRALQMIANGEYLDENPF